MLKKIVFKLVSKTSNIPKRHLIPKAYRHITKKQTKTHPFYITIRYNKISFKKLLFLLPPIFLAKKTNLSLTKIIVIEKDFPRSRSKEFKLDVLDIQEYIHKRFWLNLSTTKQQQNYKNNNNKQYMNFWIFKAREGKYIFFFT